MESSVVVVAIKLAKQKLDSQGIQIKFTTMEHQPSNKQHFQIYLNFLKKLRRRFPAIPVIRQVSLTRYLPALSAWLAVWCQKLTTQLYTQLVQSGDAEKYYESYYSKIVTNSQNWIENLDQKLTALAFKNLGKKIFHFSRNPQQTFHSTEI